MNHLKSKASELFKNVPSQDERAANASPNQDAAFDAGIERVLRKKPSRFFRRQGDRLLPALPPAPKSLREALPLVAKDDVGGYKEAADKPLPPRPVSVRSSESQAQGVAGESPGKAPKAKVAELVIKKRPSFVSLRKSSSRIFRTARGDHDPPPPPLPQIPIDKPTPKPRQPTLRGLYSVHSRRSSRSSSGRAVSISRPVSSAQVSQLPAVLNVPRFYFVKPSGPIPPRPPRPESIDFELVALSRDVGSRMVLHTPTRARTLTASTASSARSRALTRVGSEEACARLGLPSGHSSFSTPRSPIFDSPLGSPLAANFPLDPTRALPFRDSLGSVKGYGRFSAYVKARQQYESGGYGDGVSCEDRDWDPLRCTGRAGVRTGRWRSGSVGILEIEGCYSEIGGVAGISLLIYRAQSKAVR